MQRELGPTKTIKTNREAEEEQVLELCNPPIHHHFHQEICLTLPISLVTQTSPKAIQSPLQWLDEPWLLIKNPRAARAPVFLVGLSQLITLIAQVKQAPF